MEKTGISVQGFTLGSVITSMKGAYSGDFFEISRRAVLKMDRIFF